MCTYAIGCVRFAASSNLDMGCQCLPRLMRTADELLLCAAHFEIMKLTWDQEKRLQDHREALISVFKMEEWRTNSVARRVAEPESSDLDSEAGAHHEFHDASARVGGASSPPPFTPILPFGPPRASQPPYRDYE